MEGYAATFPCVRLRLWRATCSSSLLRAERERDAVGPAEAVLIGILPATRAAAHVIEEAAGGIVRGGDERLPPRFRRFCELERHVPVAGIVPAGTQPRDHDLEIVQQAIEVYRDQVSRLERAKILGIAQPT